MSRLNNKIYESLFGFKSLAKAEGFLTSSHFQAYFLSEMVSDERRKWVKMRGNEQMEKKERNKRR